METQESQLILSYHDFNGNSEQLSVHVSAMYAAGADVAN